MNPAIPNKPSYCEILKMIAAADALFDKQRAGKSPKDGPNRPMPLRISSSQIRAARHLAKSLASRHCGRDWAIAIDDPAGRKRTGGLRFEGSYRRHPRRPRIGRRDLRRGERRGGGGEVEEGREMITAVALA